MTDRRAAALLAAAVVLAAVFSLRGLGFHNDDYALLAALQRGSFTEEFGGLFYTRPLDLLFFKGLYALFGTAPPGYHLVSRLLDLTVGWAFYKWLREEGIKCRLALLAAFLTALYPNHDAARCWVGGLVAQAGLAAALGSILLFRRGHRAMGAVAFLASILLYEAPSLLFFGLPLLAYIKERRLKDSILPYWPLFAAFAAGAAWQRIIVPLTLAAERHPVSLSFSHAFKVLGAGFECTFANRLAHGIARGAQYAWGTFSPLEWALWAAAAGALAVWSARLAREAEPQPALPALPLAGALFLLGYAPYFFDAAYMPTAFSANNRLNLTGALGGALFFSWLAARWRRGGPLLAGGLSAAFLLANWASNSQYAEAYRRQLGILDGLTAALPADAKTVLLYGFEERVGSAVVFESTFDLEGALHLRGVNIAAKVGQGRMHYMPEAAVLSWYGDSPLPYEGLYLYHARSRRILPLPTQPAALSTVSDIQFLQ